MNFLNMIEGKECRDLRSIRRGLLSAGGIAMVSVLVLAMALISPHFRAYAQSENPNMYAVDYSSYFLIGGIIVATAIGVGWIAIAYSHTKSRLKEQAEKILYDPRFEKLMVDIDRQARNTGDRSSSQFKNELDRRLHDALTIENLRDIGLPINMQHKISYATKGENRPTGTSGGPHEDTGSSGSSGRTTQECTEIRICVGISTPFGSAQICRTFKVCDPAKAAMI